MLVVACSFLGLCVPARLGLRDMAEQSSTSVTQGEAVMGRSSFLTVVVGPRSMFREGLARILSAAGFEIAAAASSVADIAADQLPKDQPILFVVDVSSDQGATLREIELCKDQYPSERIALLADHDQLSHSSDIAEAFRAGAHAYFVRPNCESFIKSLELVMLGETILPPQLMSLMLHHQNEEAVASNLARDVEVSNKDEDKYPRLSIRELAVLRCLIAGDSNKMIARNNSIAEATVKVHVKAILRKIRVHNRTQAAIWGMSHDLFPGETNNSSSAGATT